MNLVTVRKILLIIITGATGFIGRRLASFAAKHLKKSHILCLIWDKDSPLERSGRKILGELGLKTKLIDLVTGKGMDNIPKSPSLVIHLAANTETSELDHRVNDLGTKNLVNALGKLGPKTHFIHVSSTAFMSGRKNCSVPFDENTPPTPTNEYGRSKLRAEQWLQSRCKTDKFRLTIVRFPTVFGSNPRKNSFFDLLKKLIIKKSLFARLNWPGLTSLIHVEDAAKILILLVQKSPKPGSPEIYILQSESLTMAQISAKMHKALGYPYKGIILPTLFWKLCSFGRKYVYLLEKVLPLNVYNYPWRASLLVDNVIYCRSNKIRKVLAKWKPRTLENTIEDVI